MDSPMLNTRQKEIVDHIISNGFKKKEFVFKAKDNHKFELRFKGSKFYIIIDKDILISPGINGSMVSSFPNATWKNNMEYLRIWLDLLSKEVEAGNPWEDDKDEFYFYQEINNEYEDGQANFTEIEINNISVCLEEIKQYLLSNTALTQQQLNAIQSDVTRLEANSNKISAKDWYLLFIGQLFSWVASGILTPEQPKYLFNKLIESVASGMKTVFKILG